MSNKENPSSQPIVKITDKETFQRLLAELNTTGRRLTHREMLSLPPGTLVRISTKRKGVIVDVLEGKLIFQRAADVNNDERRYGVAWDNKVCYTFHPAKYELLKFPDQS